MGLLLDLFPSNSQSYNLLANALKYVSIDLHRRNLLVDKFHNATNPTLDVLFEPIVYRQVCLYVSNYVLLSRV
jgi:hypothetical protein